MSGFRGVNFKNCFLKQFCNSAFYCITCNMSGRSPMGEFISPDCINNLYSEFWFERPLSEDGLALWWHPLADRTLSPRLISPSRALLPAMNENLFDPLMEFRFCHTYAVLFKWQALNMFAFKQVILFNEGPSSICDTQIAVQKYLTDRNNLILTMSLRSGSEIYCNLADV